MTVTQQPPDAGVPGGSDPSGTEPPDTSEGRWSATRSAVVALVDTRRAEALLLERFEHDREFPSEWCFPGGRVERGERIDDAARREVLEETGYTAVDLECVGSHGSTGRTGRRYLIDCFICITWSGSAIAYPSREHAGAAWVSIPDLANLEPIGETTAFLARELVRRFADPPTHLPEERVYRP